MYQTVVNRKLVRDMYKKETVVRFSEADDVKEFVNAASKCEFDIDVKYRRALLDAKSILGMLQVGLMTEMSVCYDGTNNSFETVVEKYSIA